MFSRPLNLIRLKSPENTNDAVKDFISKDNCTLLIGEKPLFGKTRNGKRDWKIVEGNLFMSIGLFNEDVKTGEIVLKVVVAVGELLSNWIKDIQYKWPNDILVNGKKICGILLEYNSGKLVIGIGMNVLHSPYEWTTCLDKYHQISLDELSLQILASLREHESKPIEQIIKILRSKAFLLGKEIDFNTNGKLERGLFIDVAPDGALVLEDLYTKEQKKFYSGSICTT
ncbi:biotin--[acetyl-CoA-carboxylase] ligase [Neorickettsia sennetsu]|uniref:Biotin--acetyl-CoA-carboxylase ligase n=1 Tax=Ehrlichia sennetsu (strain ATCC VR-367 / Miyayama) TaxID=222891 RepID=Q2GD76_EHRS3|nr:biotin--[acetyl-CoA-carboxylase] ligase [Neorickettsia sennetsu]ABD45814.1 biotin--acetyl-CoA-carboxylase ligase [Neorickettsia sennetsu str. Miyayama]